MKNLLKYWKVFGIATVVVLVNLLVLNRVKLAYGAYQWEKYAAAYPISGEPLDMLQQTGGGTNTVVVQGNYAFIGEGPALVVLNVQDPLNPVQVGKSRVLPDIIYGATLVGSYVFVAAGDAGLRIFNISNPADPQEVGFFDTTGFSVGLAVSGQYAYLVERQEGVRVIDISTPASPVEVGFYDVTINNPYSWVYSIALDNLGHAYLGTHGTVLVLDLTDPTAPVEIASIFTQGASGLTYLNGKLYVAAGGAGLHILDVTTANAPVEMGVFNSTGWAYSVAVSGSYAYLADGYTSYENRGPGLSIVNILDPAQPFEAGFVSSPGNAFEVALVGNQAFLAAGEAGIRILDVTDPSSIWNIGSYLAPAWNAERVAVSGNYAFVAGSGNGLQILNITNKAKPVESAIFSGAIQSSDVFISGQYAYVADGVAGLYIVDISNPISSTQVGFLSMPYRLNGVTVVGSTAYLAAGYYGLCVVDVVDPTLPTLSACYSGGRSAQRVAVSGAYAYVADGSAGLTIFDISVPTALVFVDTYATLGYASDVAVSGNYVYIADMDDGLRVLNVTNPATATEVGFYDTASYAQGVVLNGSYAFVADLADGVRVLNVSNPAAIVEAGFFDTQGVANGIALASSYLFVADGNSGLAILDITNPTSPSLAGSRDTAGIANGILLAGQYAYLTEANSGVRVLNVLNPLEPSEISFIDTPGSARRTVINNTTAYIADGTNGVFIADISNPAAPIKLSQVSTPGWVSGVAVQGNYLYVADDGSNLRIVNIANPAVPSETGVYTMTGTVADVAVSGQIAYAVTQEGYLFTVDVSNPAVPTEIGSFAIGGTAYRVLIVGNYVYIAAGSNGLRIIDVSNPAVPVEVGFYDTPGNARSVFIQGGYVFVADEIGLLVLDITDLTAPIELGYHRLPGQVRDVQVVGNKAYVAAGYSGGLQIVDLTDLSGPFEVGAYEPVGVPFGLAIQGDVAYIAEAGRGVRIMDISDISNPIQIGLLDTPGKAHSIVLSGETAFIASETGGLRIASITDPTSPKEIGAITDCSPGSFEVIGKTAYVVCGNALTIVDVTNPTVPVFLGNYRSPYGVISIAISGNYAYFTDYQAISIHVVDITSPGNISEVGLGAFSGVAYDMTAVGNYLFIASYTDGLLIFDISNPLSPIQISTLDTPGWATYVRVFGNYAYIADGYWGGVRVIDVSNPAAPVEAGFYNTPGSAYEVALHGEFIYVADRDGGLSVYRFKPKAAVQPGQPAQLTSPSGAVQIDFPAGVVNSPTTFTFTPEISPTQSTGLKNFAGISFNLTAADASGNPITSFQTPYTVTLNYSDENILGLDENSLFLYYWNTTTNAWEDAASTCAPTSTYLRSPANNSLKIKICHLTEFALLQPTEISAVNGSVDFQGRPTPPASPWITSLRVKLTPLIISNPAYSLTVTTDASGGFNLSGFLPGAYTASIKNRHTLQNVIPVTLAPNANQIDFGVLKEGDANDDNAISLVDFSVLAKTYNRCSGSPGFDARPDFNQDTCTNDLDYALLAANFGLAGQTAGVTDVFESARQPNPVAGVQLAVSPANRSIFVGHTITLTVQVNSGSQPVDAASAYLNFDPSLLRVERVIPGAFLPKILANTYNNTTGQINFAAGALTNFPAGSFTLAQIAVTALKTSPAATLAFNSAAMRTSEATYGGQIVQSGLSAGNFVLNSGLFLSMVARQESYSISGKVADLSAAPISGVTLTCGSSVSTTDNNGLYTLSGLAAGSCSLTPTKNGYTFSPSVMNNLSVPPSLGDRNFLGIFTPTPTTTNTPVSSATATNTPAPSTTATSTSTPSATATNTSIPTETPTNTPPPVINTPTPTNPPVPCSNIVLNGGFETRSDWLLPVTAYSADYSIDQAKSGSWSMRAGILNPIYNRYSYSSIQQDVTILGDVTSANLEFWLFPQTGESILQPLPNIPFNMSFGKQPLASDIQYVIIMDPYYNILDRLVWQRNNSKAWTYYTFNLLNFNGHNYAGQKIKLDFGVYNDGYSGATSMFIDEVNLTTCR